MELSTTRDSSRSKVSGSPSSIRLVFSKLREDALDHVAGDREGRAAEADDGALVAGSSRTRAIDSPRKPVAAAASKSISASTASRSRTAGPRTGPRPSTNSTSRRHGGGRHEDVAEDHRRVHPVAADGLERDLGGSLGVVHHPEKRRAAPWPPGIRAGSGRPDASSRRGDGRSLRRGTRRGSGLGVSTGGDLGGLRCGFAPNHIPRRRSCRGSCRSP